MQSVSNNKNGSLSSSCRLTNVGEDMGSKVIQVLQHLVSLRKNARRFRVVLREEKWRLNMRFGK